MRRLVPVMVLVALLATGCSKGTTGIVKKNEKKVVRIQKVLTNIPVFPGARFDLDNTFIYESGNIRAAVITMFAPGTLKDAVDFYKRKMAEEGWELVSSFVYQNRASMFFDSADTSCNVEIEQKGGELSIVVRTGTKSVLQDVK